jgi:hypothetical protein
VPRALPDLFAGQPLVVAGHYDRAATGTVIIHGKLGGRDVRFDVPVTLPDQDAARPAIASVWARQRITELSRRLVRKADAALEHEILALALDHHILSPYTAFVAVDDSRVTAGGAAKQVAVPVEVPALVGAISSGGGSGYGSGGGSGYGGYGFGIGIGSYGTIGHGSGSGQASGEASGEGSGTIGSGTIGVSSSGGGLLSRSRSLALPTVTLAQPVVSSGGLDKAIVRRYIKRRLNAVRYCYEKALIARPTLAGTLTAYFMIDATGHVAQSSASGLGDPEVEACVAKAIEAIEFPVAQGGGTVTVNYPFTFAPPVVRPEDHPEARL